MTDQKSIHELRLHENILNDRGYPMVTRVAGGWIYYTHCNNSVSNTISVSAVFVPYSDEFKKPAKAPKPSNADDPQLWTRAKLRRYISSLPDYGKS